MSTSFRPASANRRTRRWRFGVAVFAAALTATMLPTVAQAAVPSLRVLDRTVTERDAAGLVAKVPVVLSRAAPRRVTVQYTTVNGTARAPADYAAKSGKLAFPVGVKKKFVAVPIVGDTFNEGTETFKVRIFNPTRARIADRIGIVTINDNDVMPGLTAVNTQVVEPNSGGILMQFPVTLSQPSAQQVSVAYAITSGTATEGDDYSVVDDTGTLVFPAGTVSRNVTVTVIGDTADEVNETVNLSIVSPVNAVIADGSAVGTIVDNDGPNITIHNVTRNEGWTATNPFTFTVSLSATSPQTVSVHYATANGTAVAPGDYAATSGTLTFLPGQTAKTVTVNVPGDLVGEPTETFVVNLSTPVNGTITDSQGVGTIVNDDVTSTDEGIGAATFLGAVSGDTSSSPVSSGTQSILLGDADWYRISLNENDFVWLSPEDLYARVSLVVADGPTQSTGDIDMQIYRSNGTLVGSSSLGSTSDELFFARKVDDANGFFVDPNNSTFFYVKVYGFGSVINNYALTVTGDVSGTPVGNL